MTRTTFPLDPTTLAFSGHETFVLRSNWLKKAYDLLRMTPDLFATDDAFVRLGVGKNMANSIRYWGRVCAIFVRTADRNEYQATWLGDALFADATGWDPFLVTPTSHWLLHYQIAAQPATAFTWYYTFNLLRRGEFTASQLAQQITDLVAELGGKVPSAATIGRDVECMLRCYQRPNVAQLAGMAEDALHCPLSDLGLIQQLPGQPTYRLVSGAHTDLPDALVAYAALQQARTLERTSVAFNELAYGERSPGRIFRLDEDALLTRLLHIETLTHGRARYNDNGGIRQVIWTQLDDDDLDHRLLEAAFAVEQRYA